MRLCACIKVWQVPLIIDRVNNKRMCNDCGATWHEMATMPNRKYISENLIVKVNEHGHINTIKIDGNRIHASIKY